MKQTLSSHFWLHQHRLDEADELVMAKIKADNEWPDKQAALECQWQEVVDILDRRLQKIDDAQHSPYHEDEKPSFNEVLTLSMLHWEAMKILREVQGSWFLANTMGPHDPQMYQILTGVILT